MNPPTGARAAPTPPERLAPGTELALSPGSEDGREVSEATYWEDYYERSDIRYEWNRGRLEEKPVSDYETFCVYKWFLLLLEQFFETRPIGALVALEMGFRLALPDGVVIRKPDFAVVRHDNPRPLRPRDVSYRGVFDLCVEALSDLTARDIERDTVRKKAEYAAGGVPEYYIVHREAERQSFFARTPAGLYAPISPRDGVIRSQVLPGFRFRIADLCRRPSPRALLDDPVYADYVLPDWRAAERRAEALAARIAAERDAREAAERRAEVASQRADAEARRAASEAQRADAEARRAASEAQRADAEARRADAQAREIAAEREARERAERELAALRARLVSSGTPPDAQS